jgi:hypothetical protein
MDRIAGSPWRNGALRMFWAYHRLSQLPEHESGDEVAAHPLHSQGLDRDPTVTKMVPVVCGRAGVR